MRNLPTLGPTTAHGAAINAYPAHHQGVGVEVGKYAQIAAGRGYIRMNVEDRREAVKELAAEGLSQRQIGEVVGVTEATINRDLKGVSNVTTSDSADEPTDPIARIDTQTGELIQFEPTKSLDRDAQADAVIEYARRLHDWPLLERAVEQKIEEQAEFVQWWRDRVTPRQSPGRNGQSNADPRSISKSDAESLTGITQQQVSKWAKRLKDEGKYRATLFGAAIVRRLISCGQRLKEKRDTLPHGQWLPWLEANREALGFGERTARRLIAGAESNRTLTSDIDPKEALAFNRKIWGNHNHRAEGTGENVVSLNLRRRHLDESQRAMVAGKLANLPRGSNQHASIEAPSQQVAADMLSVGRASVQRAREVLDHGTPALSQEVSV